MKIEKMEKTEKPDNPEKSSLDKSSMVKKRTLRQKAEIGRILRKG